MKYARVGLLALGLLALGAPVALAQDADPLRAAILAKSEDELRNIIAQVDTQQPGTIEMPPADADLESLRAVVYEYAQKERPPPGGIRPWATGGAAPVGKAPAIDPKPGGAGADKKVDISAMLFKKLDLDRNKKLSPEELGPMIAQVNAAAEGKGEPKVDFFKQLDKNLDGFVDREESDAFFKMVMGAGAGKGSGGGGGAATPSGGAATPAGGAAAAKPEGVAGLAAQMLAALDKDGDGKLDSTEMEAVIEKVAAEAKARGRSDYIGFEDLDADNDGLVDAEEAQAFFVAMEGELAKQEL